MTSAGNTTEQPVLEHSECVDQAAGEIFAATCGAELKEVPDEGGLAADGVILAVISIVGDVEWSIFLGLPRKTSTSVAEKFAGFEIPFDSEDMGDAIGELTNILAGQVKALLDQRSVKAEISLPSVMRVENLQVLGQRNVSVSKTCWDCSLGKLWTGVVSLRNPGIAA